MRVRSGAVVLLLVLVVAAAEGRQITSASLSLSAYLAELDRLRSDVEQLSDQHPDAATALLASIPSGWRVETSTQTFKISALWLRHDLAVWRAKPEADLQAQMLARLATVRAGAASFEATPADSLLARAELAEILARPEFQNIRGPGWAERLRQRALELLVDLLRRALGSSAMPAITNVVVYALIALAVAVVAHWMYRSLKHSARLEAVVPGGRAASGRPWTAWLADANASATNAEWREAVRSAYWCGVAFLEAQGAWRPDRSRTPREYLRLLPPAHERTMPLGALTALLERVWYGAEPAEATHFDAALAELKNLGCPST